jgi:fatty acid desaturase
MTRDRDVRRVIREELPPALFRRRPARCLFLIPLLAATAGGSLVLLIVPMPWYAAVPLAALVGNFHASMLFLGHEIGHGAAVRSRRLQRLLLYPGCAIFLLSPWLWIVWHNGSHHGHTNRPGEDPDLFGTLDEFLRRPPSSRTLIKAAFGGRRWPSAVYLFVFFSLQVQVVLWWKSRHLPGYARLRRGRAAADTLLMALGWGLVAAASGARGTLLVVVVPMLVANFVVMSYVVTNHMIRPLRDESDILATTMSVTTLRVVDRMHFHFSHHVEHHLFPASSSSTAPEVRRCLQRHFGDAYLAPPHWRALLTVFRTARFYDGYDQLVEPWSGRRDDLSAIAMDLRSVGADARADLSDR